ncbi:MAG: hypothetical protein FWF29_01435 [Treponema sp.]|nr:hypothetical protein [Treponema sp.]
MKKTRHAQFYRLGFLFIALTLVLQAACHAPVAETGGPYTITVTQPAEGGSFTVQAGDSEPVDSGIQALKGDKITLIALADTGYRFIRFECDGANLESGSGSVRTFIMPAAPVSLSAFFQAVENTPDDKPVPPLEYGTTPAQQGLGVFVYDDYPGVEDFSDYVGLYVEYAEDFMDRWISSDAGWWHYQDESRPAYWGEWKAAQPETRRLIYTVPPFVGLNFPGSWDGDKANSAEARQAYQAAARGDFNVYYKTLGEAFVKYGLGDTIIRFGHEMNGDWYTWSIKADNDSEAIRQEKQLNFAETFRQFADTLRAIPGSDFKFCWNPNCAGGDDDPGILERAYPGNDYVDYIAFDQYDWWRLEYRDNNYEYFNPATTQARRSQIQQLAWTNMVNQSAGMNWFADFARSKGKPLAAAEWGLWHLDKTDNPEDDWTLAGGDNPVFIENMYNWLNVNNAAWNVYFMFGDGGHSLFDTITYPQAIGKFMELWNPHKATQVRPALPPENVPDFTGEVRRARDAVLGADNIWLLSDPWAYSDGILVAMWASGSYSVNTTLTFENCPESYGFALVYQLPMASRTGALNDLWCSLYINGSKQKSVLLPNGGMGWSGSYRVMAFDDVYVPPGASVSFRADINDSGSNSSVQTPIKFDYIIFR